MSILDYQLENNSLSSNYIFESNNQSYNLEIANDFAQRVFEKYGVHLKNDMNPDYYLIDNADDVIDIDTVRAMIKDISLKPQNGKIKIYIIHNAHKLRVEGSNALLKTIEELKDYNMAIFTTRNSQLLLPTIRSRCQIVKLEDTPADFDIDMVKLTNILAELYRGNASAFYKNKSFFEGLKDYRGILLDSIISIFGDVVSFKYGNKSFEDKDYEKSIRQLSLMPFDQIESLVNLLYDIKTGFRTNINYDLAIEEIVFNIYKGGMKL